jgi:hypothetical protein
LKLIDTGGGNYRIVGNAITALDQATFLVRNAAGTSTLLTISTATGVTVFGGPVGFNENNPSAQVQITTATAGAKGLIIKGLPQRTISNVALTSNVATITTSVAHGFLTGNAVVISGLTNSVLNGTYTIASTPTTTTFTFAKTNANITSVADSGTAIVSQTGNYVEILNGSGTAVASIDFGGNFITTGTGAYLQNNSAAITFGASLDTTLSRNAANSLNLSGSLAVGSASAIGIGLSVTASAANHIGQRITGASGQSADLFQVFTNGGSTLTKIDSSGHMTINANGGSQLSLSDTSGLGVSLITLNGLSSGWSLRCQGNASDAFWLFNNTNGVKPFVVETDSRIGIGAGTTISGAQLAIITKDSITKPLVARAAATITKTINNVALTSNVATITTSTAHGFVGGATVVISGLTTTALNGTYTVASTPTTTTFTFAKTNADIASTADSGTAVVSQTANLQEWQNGSGTALGIVTNAGNLCFGSQTTQVVPARITAYEDNSQAIFGVCRNTVAVNDNLGGLQWYSSVIQYPVASITCVAGPSFIDSGNLIFSTRSSGSSQTERMRIDPNGSVGVNEQSPGAQLQVTAKTSSTKGLIVKAAASATANIQEWQDSTGSSIGTFGANGALIAKSLQCSGTGGQFSVGRRDTGAADWAIYSGSGDLQFYNSGDKVVFKADGKVGINEGNPGAQLQVDTMAAATKGLIVKGFTSQSANLQEWQSSVGTVLSYIDAGGALIVKGIQLGSAGNTGIGDASNGSAIAFNAGLVGVNTVSAAAQLHVVVSSASTKGLIVKAAASQTANIFEAQDSSAALLAAVYPTGEVKAKGLITSIVSKTSAYTLTTSDDMVIADATSGAFTVTLPNATTVGDGREFTVKKIDSSANAVTIGTTSSQTIDGATTKALSAQWTSITVKALSGAWYIK